MYSLQAHPFNGPGSIWNRETQGRFLRQTGSTVLLCLLLTQPMSDVDASDTACVHMHV